MVRVFHLADTHLGFQAYNRLTPEGLNQREVDFQEAFRRAVDAAVEDPPDVLVHAGDLFDHPRPNNRAIAFCLQQVRRLSEARIETVLVSGNHDAPRMRETGSIFRVFEGMPHVHPVYRGEAQRLDLAGATVHAVPQGITQEAFQAQVRSCRRSGGQPNLLVVHGTVLGVDGLFTSEFNEYQIPLGDLRPDFDYIALGHFHNHKRVAPNAVYAGSLEACTFNEAGQEKGWLVADVEAGQARTRFVRSGARPLADLGRVDAAGAGQNELLDRIRGILDAAPRDAVLRLTVDRLDRSTARGVDWNALRMRRPDAVHLELRLDFLQEATALDGDVRLGPVAQEFDRFLSRYPLRQTPRERVRQTALRLLARATGGDDAA